METAWLYFKLYQRICILVKFTLGCSQGAGEDIQLRNYLLDLGYNDDITTEI